jgi:hypothetical protein
MTQPNDYMVALQACNILMHKFLTKVHPMEDDAITYNSEAHGKEAQHEPKTILIRNKQIAGG